MVEDKFKSRIKMDFEYTCAAKTDITKTFEKEIQRLKETNTQIPCRRIKMRGDYTIVENSYE